MRSFGALYLVQLMGIGFNIKMVLKRGIIFPEISDLATFIITCYICFLIMNTFKGLIGVSICTLLACLHLMGFIFVKKEKLIKIYLQVKNE